ncbi:hypothetical protein FGO68_gene12638 [Halteria grandinella]|uniref:Uncharacterized protein n=1 Tax=Halteria grandinella TaxID=5974 RepID=A0A8J8N9R8_HALGN|nr:hypothetical protein FGO68_gene12638 [Halteria grandinella]
MDIFINIKLTRKMLKVLLNHLTYNIIGNIRIGFQDFSMCLLFYTLVSKESSKVQTGRNTSQIYFLLYKTTVVLTLEIYSSQYRDRAIQYFQYFDQVSQHS